MAPEGSGSEQSIPAVPTAHRVKIQDTKRHSHTKQSSELADGDEAQRGGHGIAKDSEGTVPPTTAASVVSVASPASETREMRHSETHEQRRQRFAAAALRRQEASAQVN